MGKINILLYNILILSVLGCHSPATPKYSYPIEIQSPEYIPELLTLPVLCNIDGYCILKRVIREVGQECLEYIESPEKLDPEERPSSYSSNAAEIIAPSYTERFIYIPDSPTSFDRDLMCSLRGWIATDISKASSLIPAYTMYSRIILFKSHNRNGERVYFSLSTDETDVVELTFMRPAVPWPMIDDDSRGGFVICDSLGEGQGHLSGYYKAFLSRRSAEVLRNISGSLEGLRNAEGEE